MEIEGDDFYLIRIIHQRRVNKIAMGLCNGWTFSRHARADKRNWYDVRKDRGIDLSIDLDLVSLEGPAVNRRANMTDVALMRSVTMQRHAADDSHCRKSAPREPRPDVFGSLNWHEVKRSH